MTSEITELKYTSLIKMIILEENFKWHLEAYASELFTWYEEVFSTQIMRHSTLYFKFYFYDWIPWFSLFSAVQKYIDKRKKS